MQTYLHASSFGSRRLPLADSSPLTTFALSPDAADHLVAGDTLFARFISDPMAADNVFTSGNAFKAVAQAVETHASNDLRVQWWVGVCSEDGETLRATIRGKVNATTEVNGTLSSRFLNSTLSGSYTTVAGDRLVVEVGLQGTPVTASQVQGHNGSLRFGGNGSGFLPENNTETSTSLNPWVEFTTNIVWDGKWRLDAYCPLCGAHLGVKTQPDTTAGQATDIHVHMGFSVSGACANGHEWAATFGVVLHRVS